MAASVPTDPCRSRVRFSGHQVVKAVIDELVERFGSRWFEGNRQPLRLAVREVHLDATVETSNDAVEFAVGVEMFLARSLFALLSEIRQHRFNRCRLVVFRDVIPDEERISVDSAS